MHRCRGVLKVWFVDLWIVSGLAEVSFYVCDDSWRFEDYWGARRAA
jgi:hypothetical protein